MPIIQALAHFLDDNDIADLGVDLFIDQMNDSPAATMMIAAKISPAPDYYLDTQTFDFEVWCRDPQSKEAVNRLETVHKLLHRYHHVLLGDYYIYFIGATGNIEPYAKDISGRSLHKIDFTAVYRDTRSIS